jgi:cytochrome b6-f complex iron-sulfur subunit
LDTRRGFFKSLLSVLGLAALPIRSARAKSLAVPLEKAPKLKKVGGWTVLKIKDHSILFVRDAKDSVRALSSACTHMQCQMSYNADSQHIECPCHGSSFDLTGKVLKTPAKNPLRNYPAKLSGGRVIVTVD